MQHDGVAEKLVGALLENSFLESEICEMTKNISQHPLLNLSVLAEYAGMPEGELRSFVYYKMKKIFDKIDEEIFLKLFPLPEEGPPGKEE